MVLFTNMECKDSLSLLDPDTLEGMMRIKQKSKKSLDCIYKNHIAIMIFCPYNTYTRLKSISISSSGKNFERTVPGYPAKMKSWVCTVSSVKVLNCSEC